ncbi:hypothetical protein TKK_0004593 [Trichogramma kaykai]
MDDKRMFQLQLGKQKALRPVYISRKYLLLFIENSSEELVCKYKISIIKNTKIFKTHTGQNTFSKNYNAKVVFDIGSSDFRNFISSDGTLGFCCELSVTTGDQLNMNKVMVPNLKFDWVLLDENLSDIKLRTASGKEIPAHKLMLATASPVFKAMFTLDMLEKKSQSVNMIDISYEAAIEMLRYIYTGSIENGEFSLAMELLLVGEKYQLEGLKNKCEKILSLELSSENAVDILKVANKCNMSSLKKNAVDFIKQYMSVSSDSDDVGNMILSMERLFAK